MTPRRVWRMRMDEAVGYLSGRAAAMERIRGTKATADRRDALGFAKGAMDEQVQKSFDGKTRTTPIQSLESLVRLLGRGGGSEKGIGAIRPEAVLRPRGE